MIVLKLSYKFRVYPSAPQRIELAKAFGCARVVWNDALRIRQDAYKQGKSVPSIVELAKLVITEAKKTPERRLCEAPWDRATQVGPG